MDILTIIDGSFVGFTPNYSSDNIMVKKSIPNSQKERREGGMTLTLTDGPELDGRKLEPSIKLRYSFQVQAGPAKRE